MRIVITYGTFDLLHIGHINLLRRAKRLGDYLIVGLSTEKFNRIKGKGQIFSYKERKKILRSIRYVDKIIPEKSWEQKTKDVKRYKADVFVIGDDWKGRFDFLKRFCDVVYLPRTKGISTEQIKRKIWNEINFKKVQKKT